MKGLQVTRWICWRPSLILRSLRDSPMASEMTCWRQLYWKSNCRTSATFVWTGGSWRKDRWFQSLCEENKKPNHYRAYVNHCVSDQTLKWQIAKNFNLTVFPEMLSHFLQSVFVLAALQLRIICLHYKDHCMSIFGEMWSLSSCLRITNFTLVFTSVIVSFDLFTWTNSKIEKYAKSY